MTFNFHIVDVFARRKYTGNQLAVFTAAGELSSEEMQQIAQEMNYSESTFIFSEETSNDLHAGVFADFYGVPEDPATGSANGCLAGYLAQHNYFRQKTFDIRVEQGYELHRPSILHLRTEIVRDDIHVYVGSQVIPVAEGRLL